MGDHLERACRNCGSFLHHEDNCHVSEDGDFVDGIYDGRHLVDALHPYGRCTCWGEGRCALCREWAEEEENDNG